MKVQRSLEMAARGRERNTSSSARDTFSSHCLHRRRGFKPSPSSVEEIDTKRDVVARCCSPDVSAPAGTEILVFLHDVPRRCAAAFRRAGGP